MSDSENKPLADDIDAENAKVLAGHGSTHAAALRSPHWALWPDTALTAGSSTALAMACSHCHAAAPSR